MPDDVKPVYRDAVFGKVLRMFSPHSGGGFLGFDSADVVCGPSDRAMIGFDTHFPAAWLVEDFGLTEDEAAWFIAEVKRLALIPEPVTP